MVSDAFTGSRRTCVVLPRSRIFDSTTTQQHVYRRWWVVVGARIARERSDPHPHPHPLHPPHPSSSSSPLLTPKSTFFTLLTPSHPPRAYRYEGGGRAPERSRQVARTRGGGPSGHLRNPVLEHIRKQRLDHP
jgi:hypothetical protein